VTLHRLRWSGFRWTARLLLLLGRRDDALVRLQAMLAAFPGDRYALASIAHLRAEAGDPGAALQALEVLLGVRPEDADAWFNYGFLLEQGERYAEAESAFRRACALNSRLDRAWYGLGLVLIRMRRFDEAAAALRRTTELQPMSPYGWYQLARVHADRQDPEAARKIIRHLHGFEPKVAAQLERETGLSASSSG